MDGSSGEQAGRKVALWVGCYTQDMDGKGVGVVALGRDGEGGYAPLGPASQLDSPSFLALNPRVAVIYAATEGRGEVAAHTYDAEGRLAPLGSPVAVGPLLCHIAVDPSGAFLVACCFGDGTVAAIELGEDGSLGKLHRGVVSRDPHRMDRQSRAHASLMLGSGQLVSTDIGHDSLRMWQYSPQAGLELTDTVRLEPGCGPRHLARSTRGVVYVVCEYSTEVAMLYPVPRGPGLVALELQASFQSSARGRQDGDAAAELCLDASERRMYVGVRGSNRVCVLAVGDDGGLAPLAESACGGEWPRNHCLHEGRLVVALERSGAVASFALDEDGRPVHPPRLTPLGSPTHVLPAG